MARSETETTTDVAALASRLRLTATRLARTLRRQADTGLSPSQLAALTTIEGHGPMTLGALADHERVAPPSITKLVAKLEAAGLVSRRPDPVDRRVTLVSVTRDGAGLLARSRHRKTQWLAARMARLSADERARLAAAIDVLESLTAQETP